MQRDKEKDAIKCILSQQMECRTARIGSFGSINPLQLIFQVVALTTYEKTLLILEAIEKRENLKGFQLFSIK